MVIEMTTVGEFKRLLEQFDDDMALDFGGYKFKGLFPSNEGNELHVGLEEIRDPEVAIRYGDDTAYIMGLAHQGDYHNAINQAISAISQSWENDDLMGADYFALVIKDVADHMRERYVRDIADQ